MRTGAAIIVGIGACIAVLALVECGVIRPQLQATADLVKKLGDQKGLEDYRDFLITVRVGSWTLGLIAIAILIACFVIVSMRRVRRASHYAEPANDAHEMMRRLSVRGVLRFQYDILSLLALALTVAILCSAIAYLLKK